MKKTIVIECATAEVADILRQELRKIAGIEVEDEILAKAGPDLRKMVYVVAAATGIATVSATAILATISALGYDSIKINGKIVALNLISLEGAIEATKPHNVHSDSERR